MKAIMDTAVEADRFSLANLQTSVEAAIAGLPAGARLQQVSKSLTPRQQTVLVRSLLRWSFFIELVKKPKIETTKYEVRWADRLGADDPRFRSYDECLEFFEQAVVSLQSDLQQDGSRLTVLKRFLDHPLNPYELPLDYAQRHHHLGIHHSGNLTWLWGDDIKRTAGLRAQLWDPSNPLKTFFEMVYAKIQVKTYLTDRVLTGDHKTNREKRWEAHPGSVHFALRRDCLGIERVLVEAVCHFDGFPKELQARLQQGGVLAGSTDCTRCPITMKPLSFGEFKDELTQPDHGKSSFQVGHLNPLKAINDDPTSGHTAANIAWVSADGNRIQGSLTLGETRALIREIFANYERFGV